jgi:signal transduction histidine kinase
MEISSFIRTHHPAVVAEWTRRVSALPGENRLSPPALIDHMPELLGHIADWMVDHSAVTSERVERMASHHALQRLSLGFELRQITTEYSLLRATVLFLTGDAAPVASRLRFDEAVDFAIAECVDAYSSAFELARERFVDILGHDLRNPLGVISMAATLLTGNADDPEPAAIRKLAARITRSAARMEAMIADLLDFARGRRGHGIPVKVGPADMGDIARAAIEELTFANPERRVFLREAGDLQGTWDADRATQAISNLVANALIHGQDPVEVIARDSGDEVVVSVANRGSPIDPSRLPTLFEPYQLHAGSGIGRGGRVGLGLGLFIVREVLRAHGGVVAVRSDESGTRFVTRWPRHPVPRQTAPESSPSP